MLTKALVASAIYSLMPAPSPAWNETDDAYKARVEEVIAPAITEASKGSRRLALALAVTFWGESRFAPLVHSGDHRGDGGLAICMGQIRKFEPIEDWEKLAGTDYDATLRCARRSAQIMIRGWYHCNSRDPKAGYPQAMVLYGTGRTCKAEESIWKNIFLDRGKKFVELERKFR